MKLAKERLDFGLYTNRAQEMLQFWQERVGLPFEETLPAGGGVHQHRHGMNGSVFKLNHSRESLPETPASGYRELLIARQGLDGEESLCDPDGNRVRLVAPGTHGIEGFGVILGVHDEETHRAFFGKVLKLEETDDGHFCWGNSILIIRHDPQMPDDAADTHNAKMRASGFRYLTVQVWDVDEAYAEVVERGGLAGHAPVTLGKVARIAFVRDPDGNWIEISQRASLTGPLPEQ